MKSFYKVGLVPSFVSLSFLCMYQEVTSLSSGTLVLPRSQTVNAARELVGWQREINVPHSNGKYWVPHSNYWSFSLAAEYNRSLGMHRVTNYLLGSSNLLVAGSAYQECVPFCGVTLLADYFGLPRDFKSEVKLTPSKIEFLMDFDFYYGLNRVFEGFYFRLHMPIVYTNWNLDLFEQVITCGSSPYPAGYMAAVDVPRSCLPRSFEQAMHGTTTFGDMLEPLAYGKIFNRQVAVHVADFQAVFGYNFILKKNIHTGLNVRVSAPTGTTNCQEFLFQPTIGNGGHWELGGGFTAHYDHPITSTRDIPPNLGLYIDCNITHLFAAKMKRSYNLKQNGPGNRYMLLESLQQTSTGLFFSDASASEYQYRESLVNAINKTTLCSTISMALQVDAVIKAALTWDNVTFDLGYEFWFRSKEKLSCRERFPSNSFAIKGDAQVYGFTTGSEQPIPLAATQYDARLCGGQGSFNETFVNANADNPSQAFSTGAVVLLNLTTADALLLGIAQAPVASSRQSIPLTDDDIDESSGLVPRALSNKIFFHINYTWQHKDVITPYLGFGAEIESAHGSLSSNSGLSGWGAWIKGGFSR